MHLYWLILILAKALFWKLTLVSKAPKQPYHRRQKEDKKEANAISYASRTKIESRDSNTGKELFALVHFVKHFKY